MLDKFYKLNKDIATGKIDFSELYKELYTKRLGSIQSYTDRGETYLVEGYQSNPVVYSIIKIASTLAGSAKWVCRDYNGKVINVQGLDALMYRPTPDKSWRDYIQDIVTQKMYSGNAFSAVSRYGDDMPTYLRNKPKELFMMPSNEIQIWLKGGKGTIEQYVLDFQGSTRNPERGVIAADVGHWKNPNPDYSIEGDFLWGQAPLKAAALPLQTYNSTLESGVWYIQNKGIESILVSDDPDIELGTDTIRELRNKLRLQAQGPENAGNIPIVDASLKAVNLGNTPEDIKLLPLRLQAAQEICAVFNFPSQFIGIKDATYQNSKEAKKMLWEQVVIPELDEIKDGLNRWLAPMYDGDFYIDYDLNHIDALQEDRLMRGKAVKEYAGLITIPMALEMAGLPVPDFMAEEPKNMEEYRNMLYLGFTQAVVRDEQEISGINGETANPTDNKSNKDE